MRLGLGKCMALWRGHWLAALQELQRSQCLDACVVAWHSEGYTAKPKIHITPRVTPVEKERVEFADLRYLVCGVRYTNA